MQNYYQENKESDKVGVILLLRRFIPICDFRHLFKLFIYFINTNELELNH